VIKPKKRLEKAAVQELFQETSLIKLGRIADEKRREFFNGESMVTFVIDRNVNYTNICVCKCRFCAFFRDKNILDSYLLDYESIKKKTQELVAQNGTQILLQGGLNPDIPLEYYINLVSNLRKDFPNLAIHAFSPPEISFIAENNKISVRELLQDLVKIGLSSIPGGGAEILSDEIRFINSPNKINSVKWLEVMETAHNIGLKTTATMVFGFGENYNHIIEHLLKIRGLQDKTQGFTAFIPWTLVPTDNYSVFMGATAAEYLKILAISRLVLDNIKNIQVSWVTQGLKIAQIGLRFGANDFGGTMLEENVVKLAGISNISSVEEIIYIIQNTGFKAVQRDTAYNILKVF
jgi:cyclic dehypoxanthinyl futalosine synthase